MAIFAGLASLLGQFAGRILNTTLGWATILLFGKVPQSRQTLLLVIVFGSLAWIVLVVGVLVPFVGTLLLSGVALPPFVDINWVRVAMLIGAIVLPGVIGFLAMAVTEKQSRPKGMGMVKGVLRGYPFALRARHRVDRHRRRRDCAQVCGRCRSAGRTRMYRSSSSRAGTTRFCVSFVARWRTPVSRTTSVMRGHCCLGRQSCWTWWPAAAWAPLCLIG